MQLYTAAIHESQVLITLSGLARLSESDAQLLSTEA